VKGLQVGPARVGGQQAERAHLLEHPTLDESATRESGLAPLHRIRRQFSDVGERRLAGEAFQVLGEERVLPSPASGRRAE